MVDSATDFNAGAAAPASAKGRGGGISQDGKHERGGAFPNHTSYIHNMLLSCFCRYMEVLQGSGLVDQVSCPWLKMFGIRDL